MNEKEAVVQPGKTTHQPKEKEAARKTKPGVKITRVNTASGGSVAELTQGRSKMRLDTEELDRLQYALMIYRSQEKAGIHAVEVKPDGEVILSAAPDFWTGIGAAPELPHKPKGKANPNVTKES